MVRPVEVPGASGYGTPLVVTAAAAGAGRRSRRARRRASPSSSPSGADGTPGRATAPAVLAETHLATYGRDRVVVAGRTAHPIAGNAVAVTIDDTSRVQVAFGTGGGDLGPSAPLPGTTGDRLYALAASPRGDVAVVTGDLRARTRTLWLRRPGESFRAVLTSRSGRAPAGATGRGRRGRRCAASSGRTTTSSTSRHIGPGGGVGEAYKLGDGVQSDLQAAIDGTRRRAGRVEGPAGERRERRRARRPCAWRPPHPAAAVGPARTVETVGPGSMGHYVAPPGVRLGGGRRSRARWRGRAGDGAHYASRAAAVEGGRRSRRSQRSRRPALDAVLGDAASTRGGPRGRGLALGRARRGPRPRAPTSRSGRTPARRAGDAVRDAGGAQRAPTATCRRRPPVALDAARRPRARPRSPVWSPASVAVTAAALGS